MFRVFATPQLITSLIGCRIMQISCGDAHILALTSDGSVIAWGDNRYDIIHEKFLFVDEV
jgi:alpha-tubulin suppressor-like RCC1 family protein